MGLPRDAVTLIQPVQKKIIMRRQSLNTSLCINEGGVKEMLHQTITSAVCEASTAWLYDPNVVGRNWTYYWAQYSSTCSNQEPFIQQSLWAPGGTTIKTRISSKDKTSSLAMAEKVWLIFSSTRNCVVLTNIKQFSKKRRINRHPSGVIVVRKHCSKSAKQIALLCCARFFLF